MDGCMQNFDPDVVVPEHMRMIITMWAQQTYFQFTTQEFSMVSGYMENLTKLSLLGGGWALAQDNIVYPWSCILVPGYANTTV